LEGCFLSEKIHFPRGMFFPADKIADVKSRRQMAAGAGDAVPSREMLSFSLSFID
jgi:hypothetical protein